MLENIKVGDCVGTTYGLEGGQVTGFYTPNKNYKSKSLEFICDKIKETGGDLSKKLYYCGVRIGNCRGIHHEKIVKR